MTFASSNFEIAAPPERVLSVFRLVCFDIEARYSPKEEVVSLTSGVMGLLTGPHQTSFSEPSSFTIRLSEGERPVFAPEYAESAPEDVMADPVS